MNENKQIAAKPGKEPRLDGTNLVSPYGSWVCYSAEKETYCVKEIHFLPGRCDTWTVMDGRFTADSVETINGIPREHFVGKCQYPTCWHVSSGHGQGRDIRQMCETCHRNVCRLCLDHLGGLQKCQVCKKTVCYHWDDWTKQKESFCATVHEKRFYCHGCRDSQEKQ